MAGTLFFEYTKNSVTKNLPKKNLHAKSDKKKNGERQEVKYYSVIVRAVQANCHGRHSTELFWYFCACAFTTRQ